MYFFARVPIKSFFLKRNNERTSFSLTYLNIINIGVGVDNDKILVLGATNLPWILDSAIRRRY